MTIARPMTDDFIIEIALVTCSSFPAAVIQRIPAYTVSTKNSVQTKDKTIFMIRPIVSDSVVSVTPTVLYPLLLATSWVRSAETGATNTNDRPDDTTA